MRTALVALALVGAFFAAGCRSYQGGCGDGCTPNSQSCNKYQPLCCNNWNWYEPCPLIEDRDECCRSYTHVPCETPCGCR